MLKLKLLYRLSKYVVNCSVRSKVFPVEVVLFCKFLALLISLFDSVVVSSLTYCCWLNLSIIMLLSARFEKLVVLVCGITLAVMTMTRLS